MKRHVISALAVVGLLAIVQGLLAAEADQAEKKRPPGVFGRVKSVDATAGTITLTTREKGKKEGVDKNLKLAKECKVTIKGEAKSLADVTANMFVRCVTGANDEVTEIIAIERKKKDKT